MLVTLRFYKKKTLIGKKVQCSISYLFGIIFFKENKIKNINYSSTPNNISHYKWKITLTAFYFEVQM